MSGLPRWNRLGGLVLTGLLIATTVLGVHPAAAQQVGTVTGTVTKADGGAVGNVQVIVAETTIRTVTGPDGSYTLQRIPTGPHVIIFRWLGYQPQQATVTVRSGQTETVNATLQPQVVSLSEIVVSGASRTPERIVEAPAAISVVNPVNLRDASITGQAPKALSNVPGVDIVQSGVTDFNVNARGFNSSLNRRILVLQDGRDLALAFLGSQEWGASAMPLEDVSRMEMVRGPGSALYGANAFSGVLNIITPAARDVSGTKITLGGGELSTFRGDFRHAGQFGDGRFGYRINGGYTRNSTWSRSRTAFDGSDSQTEYRDAADQAVTTGVPSCTGMSDCLSIERLPLSGQTTNATTGVASGDPDDIQNIYGSGRFDYYALNNAVFTLEGGAAQVENELFVTGIGRVQVTKALRPWARANWAHPDYNIMAWYSGRNSIDPQFSLASGAPLEENSSIVHTEAQVNQSFADNKGRVVFGASVRNYSLDTEMTLMGMGDDDRSDKYFAGYGQVEFRFTPQVRLVGAARVDDGDLFETQFSPKAAIVISPTEEHSLRFTFNKAFQTPNYSEFFLRVAAGAPLADPAVLEGLLEGYYATVQDVATVGPALAAAMGTLNLPADVPWNFAASTPILALGNANLDVEKVTGWEVGYKGEFDNRFYVTADLYFNRLSNFVTDLLPGVNQAQYPSYALDSETDALADLARIDQILAAAGLPADHQLRAGNALIVAGIGALTAATGPALTTVDGQRAVVVSYANAGRVDEYGVELGAGMGITPEFRLDAAYTFFEFDVKEESLDDLVPNTPKHKFNIGMNYTGVQGLDVGVNARFVDGHDWAAGVFQGQIASTQTIDLNVGYRASNNLRVFATASNLLDQERFQLYGGSVIGRRVLGGITATF